MPKFTHTSFLPPTPLALVLAALCLFALAGCDKSGLSDVEHVQRAKDFQDKGDLQSTGIELKNALQKNPNNPEARWLLGDVYLKVKNGPAAEKEFKKALELGVSADAVKLSLGEALLLQSAYERVLQEVSAPAAATAQDKAAVARMQADAMLGLGRVEQGCQRYREAADLDANHVPAYWGLANCAYSKRDLIKAREMIDTALRLDAQNAESWAVLGDFERLGGDQEAALAAYSKALEFDPNQLGALFHRGLINVYIGQPDVAKKDLARLKKQTLGQLEAQYLEATLHYAAAETDQALNLVQQVLKASPDYQPGLLLLATVQYDRKAYEQAAQALNRYLKSAPGHLDARKLLASTYVKLNQPEVALDVLRPYIEAGQADAQVLALAGEAYLRGDDPAAAESLFEKAADLVPASAALRTKVGLSRLAAGAEEEALKELQVSSSLGSDNYRADMALAYHYIGAGQFDKALAVVAVLEQKLPDSPGTFNLKGLAYMGKQDKAEARRNFERALELNPALVSAAIRLATLDIQDKNMTGARGRYEGILKVDAVNVAAMVGLAELAALEQKEGEYLSWLERAAKTSPAAFVPRAQLANYYLGRGEKLKALSIARDALSGRPNSPEAIDLLGRVQLAAGEKENALATYTNLVSVQPQSAPAHYHLARAYAAMDNEKATRSALLKAVELAPDYADALTALAALEIRAGNQEDALKAARTLQQVAPASPTGLMLEGDVWMVAKKPLEAARFYEQALDKKQEGAVLVKRHRALVLAAKAEQADGELLKWLTAHPDDGAVRLYLAQSYTQRKLNRQAIEQFDVLLKTLPDNAMLLNNLAVLYQAEKNPKAVTTAEKAYKLEPGNPDFADTLGWILVQQNQLEKGVSLLEKAVAGTPKNPEVRYHLAYALAQAGQKSRARDEIKQLQGMSLTPELARQVEQLLQSLS